MAEHQELIAELGLPGYFREKRKPWQRAAPKDGNLPQFSQQGLDETADQLNTRPQLAFGILNG